MSVETGARATRAADSAAAPQPGTPGADSAAVAQPGTPAADDKGAPQPDRLPPLIVLCGATATGKPRLSLSLAEAIPGTEIVSADSRQVYRGMDIGTAKVGAPERSRVPHHGLDLVDPDEAFTAADFRRHALEALRGIAERGGLAVLAGGTGLYIRAVARGMALEDTGRDVAIRAELEGRLATEGLPSLANELRRRAPGLAAATDLANPRRVVRALERAMVAGDRPPPVPAGYPAPVLWLGVSTNHDLHEAWIVERASWQFANGLLDEADGLRRRYPENLPAFSALGYREAFDVLAGRSGPDVAIQRTVARTRAYSKRQRTWFRAEPEIIWLEAGEGIEDAARPLVVAFLEGTP